MIESAYKTMKERVSGGVIQAPEYVLDEIIKLEESVGDIDRIRNAPREIISVALDHMGEDHHASIIKRLSALKGMKKADILSEVSNIINILDEMDLSACNALDFMNEVKNGDA